MSITDAEIKTAEKIVAERERDQRRRVVRTEAESLARERAMAKAEAMKVLEQQRVAAAVEDAMVNSPVMTLTYEPVTVTVRHRGLGAVQTMMLTEAVRRATRVLCQAFEQQLGRVRASALGRPAPAPVDVDRLVLSLKDELEPASRMVPDSVEVSVKTTKT